MDDSIVLKKPTSIVNCPDQENCAAGKEGKLEQRSDAENHCYKCNSCFPDPDLRVCIYCVNQKKEIVVVDTGNYLILEGVEILQRLLCGNCKDGTRCKASTNPTGNHLTVNFVILKQLTYFNLKLYVFLTRYDKVDVPTHQPVLHKLREDYAFAKTEEKRKSILKELEKFVKSSEIDEPIDCDVIEVITIDDED